MARKSQEINVIVSGNSPDNIERLKKIWNKGKADLIIMEIMKAPEKYRHAIYKKVLGEFEKEINSEAVG